MKRFDWIQILLSHLITSFFFFKPSFNQSKQIIINLFHFMQSHFIQFYLSKQILTISIIKSPNSTLLYNQITRVIFVWAQIQIKIIRQTHKTTHYLIILKLIIKFYIFSFLPFSFYECVSKQI